MATSPISLPSRLPWADVFIAEGYELTLKGLFRVDSRGERQKVAGPVWPKAYTENPSRGTFGFVVAWKDRRGQTCKRSSRNACTSNAAPPGPPTEKALAMRQSRGLWVRHH